MKLWGIVRANAQIGQVPKGTLGVIIHIYNESACEVEFIVNDSSVVETVLNNLVTEE